MAVFLFLALSLTILVPEHPGTLTGTPAEGEPGSVDVTEAALAPDSGALESTWRGDAVEDGIIPASAYLGDPHARPASEAFRGPVPEPAGVLLLGLGFIAISSWAAFRKARPV